MKTLHTKGEWVTDRETFTEITVHTEKMDICTVLCIDITDEEAEANAKLIAAAPVMLEMLTKIFNIENPAFGLKGFDVERLKWEIDLVIKNATE